MILLLILTILNILFSFIAVSLVEYLMHRYYLHMDNHSHITHHHRIYNTNTGDFYNPSSKIRDVASSLSYLLIMAALSFALVLAYIIIYSQALYLSLITIILYIIWTEIMHYLFHSKYRGYFSKFSIYKNLEAHHLIHHSKFKFNFGIGSSPIDYIFRTKYKNN